MSADVGDELTVLSQVTRCLTGQALENQDGDLEVDTSSNWEPVETGDYEKIHLSDICAGCPLNGMTEQTGRRTKSSAVAEKPRDASCH